MARITLRVTGKSRTLDADPQMPLLYALCNDLDLKGPRFGCGKGQCGACPVLLDGQAVRSCITPVGVIGGGSVTTLEGRGSSAKPSVIQQAFIDEQAAQCGYCANGMVIAATALLKTNPHPSEHEIRSALAANLCRCGTHTRIVKAVQRVTSTDWASYPIITFPDVPRIEVQLINRPDAPPWGAGEMADAVVPAAIGNAVYDAVGVRLRTVPFTPERVLAGLGGQRSQAA